MLNNFYAIKFLAILNASWTSLGAYKHGMIDEHGNFIGEKPYTPEQRDSYDAFTRIVINLKRILQQTPLGNNIIGKLVTTMRLLRENTKEEDYKFILQEVHYMTGIDKETLTEDAVANTTSETNIAIASKPMKLCGLKNFKGKLESRMNDFEPHLLDGVE